MRRDAVLLNKVFCSNKKPVLNIVGSGCRKLFPASLSGGAPFLKAISTVFQGVTFCPTGGVNAQNKHEYLALNNVMAVGGTWVAPKEWVEQENWQAITDACIEANKA